MAYGVQTLYTLTLKVQSRFAHRRHVGVPNLNQSCGS